MLRGQIGVVLRQFVAVALTLATASVALTASRADADSGTIPPFRRDLGGPGHAGMYPAGVEVAADGSMVMADVGNNKIARYDSSGTLLWRVGSTGAGTLQFNNPRDVGLDNAGNVYVADLANNRVVKLTSAGAWVTSWRGPATDKMGPPIGVSVRGNNVYVADPGQKKVRVYDLDGNPVRTLAPSGACVFSPVRDAAADAAGNVYVANYTLNNILKLSPTGACLGSWGTFGNGDGQFKNPYGVTVVNDPVSGQELVHVADSNNVRVQVFTTNGTFVAKFGTAGDPALPGVMRSMRRSAANPVTGDAVAADAWGNQLEFFDRTPTGWVPLSTIAGAPAPLTSDAVFNEVRGIAFGSDGIVHAIDTVNQRFVRMTVWGAIQNACGQRGYKKGEFNWPRGIAVDHATDEVWVADTKQSLIQVGEPDCTPLHKFAGGGTALDKLNLPHSIAIRQGDRTAWIADTMNHRVVSYDVATRTPIASFGALGSGSGQFNQPRGIAVNPANGRILVADRNNNRVVELSDVGGGSMAVTRVLTAGFKKPEGVAADSDGRVYVADTANLRVVILNASGAVEGTITDGLSRVENVAVDAADRLFVADTYNDRIRVYSRTALPVDPHEIPTYVRDIVGPGVASMYPVDVAATATHYYALDPGRYRIVGVNRATGAVDYEFGGHQNFGPGSLAAARAISVDSVGNVYVADTPDNRIEKLSPSLTWLSSWGTKGTGAGQFSMVYGVEAGIGKNAAGALAEIVYTVDADRIQKFTKAGTYIGQFASTTVFHEPRQIAVHPTTNNVYIVNAREREVIAFDPDGNELFRFGESGSGDGQFNGDPRGVAIAPSGDVYVTDAGNKRVQVFGSNGAFKFVVGSEGSAPGQFTGPRGIDITSDSKLIVSDEWDFGLEEFTAAGASLRRLFGVTPPVPGVNSPRGLVVDPAGRVLVNDWWNQRIVRVDADGSNGFAWGFRGTTQQAGSINFAWDIARQPTTGRIFVANRENHEVEVFAADGSFVTRWGNRGPDPGELAFPQGVAFAPDGTLLVSDSGNHRVQRFAIDASGTGTLSAVYGSFGSTADGLGRLNTPAGISVGADGAFWVADTQNDSVQRMDTSGVWTRISSAGVAGSFGNPWGVTVAPDGAIWVADSGRDRIVKMTDSGSLLFATDGDGLGAGPLDAPFDVEFGPGGEVYVSDVWNNRVIELAFAP